MYSVDEFINALAWRRALSLPLEEGSCFGITDARELRPARWSKKDNPKQEQAVPDDEKKSL